jgi:hypothetical protein
MGNKNVEVSQQEGQDVTIGTQGNEDQRTPQGEGINNPQRGGQDDRHIPNQEKSSATNQKNAGGDNNE